LEKGYTETQGKTKSAKQVISDIHKDYDLWDTILITNHAENDLRDIYEYNAFTLLEPCTAVN
jgi:hypothetical protein